MRKDMSKKKITSLFLIAFFVIMAVSVSTISYFITTKESSSKDIKTDLKKTGASVGGDMDYITNIDRIIENSYLTESNGDPAEEAYYNVVEILPDGATSSGLDDYISTGKFKSYVFDANKENAADDMKAGMIRYDCVNVKNDTVVEGAVADVLNRADLIYLSSPFYTSYRGDKNMSEAVFNWLKTYTLDVYKPIIMDYVRPYQPTALTYESYAYVVARNHIKYRTFFWDFNRSPNPIDFFKANVVHDNTTNRNYNISFYLPFNVDNNNATGKILTITSDSASPMTEALTGYNANYNEADFKANAYFGTESKKPTSISVERKTPAEIDASISTLAKGQYDFIIIENDVMSTVMSEDTFAKLKTLSVTSQYIIYDKANIPDDDGDDIDINSSNYLKLMSLLISNKGVANYTNVLPVSYGFFADLNQADEEGKDTAKQIADLINYSDYRGSLTSGENGKLYRVLELQPCYPIDLELAATKKRREYNLSEYNGGPFVALSKDFLGDYYTNPDGILSGVSEDQVDGNTEYYKFELSKAKIAKATGLKYSQIRLDQMSTEEFIADKNVVLETYDLVYIGGNTSALLPRSLMAPYGLDAPGIPNMAYNYLPVFDMYTHTSYPVLLQTDMSYGDGVAQIGTKKIPYGAVGGKTTYVQLNGNDLTVIKYNELKDYINAGMPIVFSNVVSEEYDNVAKQERLVQMLQYHSIDPDSNMFALLAYAKKMIGNKDYSKSILWDFDITPYEGQTDYNAYNDSTKSLYGPSLKNYVTLFKEKPTEALGNAVKDSTRRPSLRIAGKPKDYIEGYESSYNINEDGTMTISATVKPADGSKTADFELELLIDLDGNGSFSEDESQQTASYTFNSEEEAEPVALTYTFADPKFFGLIHWKVIARPKGGKGECDVATGYAYYMRQEDEDKKEVNILQIMPRDKEANPTVATGEKDGHTLYLCTECQMSKYRATYNITTTNDPLLDTCGSNATVNKIDMGKHEHKFGIVKYDSAGQQTSPYEAEWASGTGAEDWDTNFADLLSDDYEFNMDILYLDELKKYTDLISNQDENDRLGYENDLDSAKEEWENAKEALELSGIEDRLNEYLEGLKGGNHTKGVLSSTYPVTVTLTDEMIDNWIKHKAYYRAFWFIGYDTKKFNDLYAEWVNLHNPVVDKYNAYRECRRLAFKSNEWLSKNYDVVVLGFAENFGGRDLTVDECADIKSFVNKGGTLLTTHDSTTRYADSGSVVLTTELRETFGMDRFHMTADKQDFSGTYKYKEYELIDSSGSDSKDAELYFSGYGAASTIGEIYANPNYKNYGAIPIGNHNIELAIILNGTDGDGNNFFITETGAAIPKGDPLTVSVKLYTSFANYQSGTVSNVKGIQNYFGLYKGQNPKDNQPDYPGVQDYNNNDLIINGLVSTMDEPVPGTTEATTEAATSNVDPVYDLPGYEEKEANITPPLIYQTFTVNHQGSSTDATESASESAISDADNPDAAEGDAEEEEEDEVGLPPINPIYFITSQSVFDLGRGEYAEVGQRWLWENKLKNIFSNMAVLAPVGVTDTTAVCESHLSTGPYLYGETSFNNNAGWNTSVWDDFEFHNDYNIGGTNRASRNNTGIITTYPFTLSSELRIAKTHAQTYALDLEDEGVAVWYSLAGCDGNLSKIRSSMFAASPRDGMDSYFLYSYSNGKGNVNYCGAGHSCVTGIGRDNNDERRLYINLIVNAVRNKSSSPTVTVHEKGTETANNPSFNDVPLVAGKKDTNPYLDKAGNYYYNVDADDETPEFNYKIRFNPTVAIKEIKVFYDLDYGIEDNISNIYDPDDGDHVLIYQYSDATAAADKEKKRYDYTSNSSLVGRLRKDMYLDADDNDIDLLQLKPKYFTPYGNYTYIVIWTKDENGKMAHQRVKIKLKEHLFDLTDAGFDSQTSKLLDMTDKTKYHL